MTATWDPHAEAHRMDRAYRDEREALRDPEVLVRYWDKNMREVGEEHNYLSLEFTYPRNAAGGLKMVCPRDMVHFDHLFDNDDKEDATIPITVNTKGFRWDGYITKASIVRDEQGVETVDIEAIHCWNHIATICCWANPFAPILAQFPRHMIQFGPVRTIVTNYLTANLLRLQGGNSLFPIAVVPVDPLRDTSRWSAASARFDMADKLFAPMLEDSGVMLTAKFFLPGEDEQPAPDWFYLDRPTVVLEAVDKSGVTGSSGTLLDGIQSWIEEFSDDGTTPVRYPNLNSTTDYEAVYGQPGKNGTFKAFPWVWYFEGEYSGIGRSEIALHKPTATDIIVGGRSPGWVNAGIEMVLKGLLSLIGLDWLYRGQLNDVFLAWMVYRNAERVRRAGPYAFRELYISGSDKAFNLDGLVAARQGLHLTRGYTSKRVTVEDNAPYVLGRDFQLGDQIGFALDDKIFTDYVTELTFTDDRETAARWQIVVGDGSDEEDSIVKAWQRLGRVAAAVKDLATDVGADLDLLIF
ncbi:phage tail protein [Nocardia sp. CDC159]|uniref:Phage tail protein n=1 Tax=Nocardia pulmonis TaxID=2951408 RepID=A0A9X2IYP8_9NOCA|nr:MULTISPECIES: phage tail protein [Nocardia]MCM6777277.1 phage tail protein [Nocardia pulmonis]MCM6790162.1 phage tail protein [Nocardia sp. CDC159]